MDELIKSILNQKLTDITTAHILAVSPGVRAYLLNYLRTQKVEVHHLEQLEEQNKNETIVAEESIKLREIDVVLNGSVQVKAVIDSGCQIVTLREDVWRELGRTFDPASRLMLEGADESTSHTKGLVRDLPIKIGPITFFVQAQVVSRSPTPMLLGMPFWALANCHKDVYADGYMTVTLSNPNPPFQTIVVPTTAREYQEVPKELRESLLNSSQDDNSDLLNAYGAFPLIAEPSLEEFFR
jgi:hypothetical protein